MFNNAADFHHSVLLIVLTPAIEQEPRYKRKILPVRAEVDYTVRMYKGERQSHNWHDEKLSDVTSSTE